jgi:hypothetical protein
MTTLPRVRLLCVIVGLGSALTGAVLGTQGCSAVAPSPEPAEAASEPVVQPAAPPLAAPETAGCPSTFASFPVGQACAGAPVSTCTYPEGTCSCVGFCGGALPIHPPPPHWKCTPRRTDGCPDAPKGACSAEGKQCSYGDCCVFTYTCEEGAWKQTAAACPA